MSLNDLRNEAVKNLTVTAVASPNRGRDIDIGEQFTVRFTIRNNFDGGDSENRGHAHYNNVRLRVSGTQYANVVGGNRTIDVVNHLGYGNAESVEVTFEAVSKLPDGFMSWPSEPYARVEAVGDFDIARYFRVFQSETFSTQIDDG